MAWEDVAYGSDVSSSGGWEDVAYGPETATPSLFSDPIGALTSKDWWLTRPSGERISAEQAVVGPLASALKGVPIIGGFADEAIASAAGGDYDQQLQKIRGYQDSFAEASPVANIGLQLATGLKAPFPDIFSKAPGITPALGNVAKLGALGVGLSGASGFGEGEGGFENRLQSAQDAAKWGGLAGLGLGAASEGMQAVAPKVLNFADDIYGKVVGKSPTAKQKIAGFVDAEGNKVAEAVAGGKQIGVLDQKFEDLMESGFKETLKASDSAADVANKVSLFKQEAGKTIGSVVDDAVKAEESLMASSAPWQKAEYFKKASPDFSKAEKLVDDIKDLSPTDGRALAKKLKDIKNYWNNSDQSLSTFKKLQEKFGLLNKKSFNQGLSEVDQLKVQLNNKIYGDLAGSLKNRLSILEKEGGLTGLVDKFTTANKQYASASTFEPLAFNAAKKFGLDAAKNELLSQRSFTGSLLGGGAAFLGAPVLAPLIAAERAVAIGSKLAPMRVAKGAEAVASGLKKSGGLSRLIAPGANLAGAALAIKAPKEMIDRAMDKAEEKIMTPPELKAPEIISATRIKEKPLTDIDPSSLASPLVDAVIMQESGGKSKAVSSKGAKGLMQLMPETAKEVAKELGLEDYDLNDPDTNRMMGEYYLSKMMKIFKDEKLALAAYNAGPGKVQMWVKKYGKSWDKIVAGINRDIEDGKLNPQYYMETRKYVPSIWRRYEKNKSIKV